MILTLKLAFLGLLLAGEGDFCFLVAQKLFDLLVGDAADLMVILDELPILVAHATAASFHERVASRVLRANVAVDTSPTFVAFAMVAGAHRSVFATGQGATYCTGKH